MADKKDNNKNSDWDELKSAAANKAVKTAVGAGHNLSTVMFNAGRGIISGAKSIAASFAKGFGLVTGKVAAVGAVAGLSPLASNLTLVLLMSILGTGVVSTIQENKYLEDLKYYTVWEEEDPCAGFQMEDNAMQFPVEDDTAAKLQSVRQIWSFCHWYAQQNNSPLSWEEVDMRVAGMVGCFEHESHISACSIEGTYDPAALNELLRELSSGQSTGAILYNGQSCAVLGGVNLSAYSNYSAPIASQYSGVETYHFDTNESFTMGSASNPLGTLTGDGGYYCGLGLGQLTGARAVALLAYSDLAGVPWYDITCQLAFWVSGDEPYYVDGAFIPYLMQTASNHPYIPTQYNSDQHFTNVRDCTICWAKIYENGNTAPESEMCLARIASAEQWYQVIKMWSQSQVDQSTINSVCQILQRTTSDANLSASLAIMGDCGEITGLGNLTLAEYASLVSYDGRMSEIFSGQRLAHYDNGTPLYQYVVRSCGISADYSDTNPYGFQDCGKGAASIIRWAGADDNMPAGTTTMEEYMQKHPEIWQPIVDAHHNGWDDIQPGDVFITNRCGSNHVYIYCGEEAWLKFHLGPDDVDANGNSYCSITFDTNDLLHGGQTYEVPVPSTIRTSCSSSFTPNGVSTSSCSMAGQGTSFSSCQNGGYWVFRNVAPQVDSIYANIVDLDRLVIGASQDGTVSTGVIADGSYGTGHNTQCTVLPDYVWVDDTGAEVVITQRYHFAWQSVRSNMYGLDDRIAGCPDYAVSYAANYNIHPAEDLLASLD